MNVKNCLLKKEKNEMKPTKICFVWFSNIQTNFFYFRKGQFRISISGYTRWTLIIRKYYLKKTEIKNEIKKYLKKQNKNEKNNFYYSASHTSFDSFIKYVWHLFSNRIFEKISKKRFHLIIIILIAPIAIFPQIFKFMIHQCIILMNLEK